MIELNAEDRTFAVSRGTYSIASLRATGVKRLDMSRGAAFAATGGRMVVVFNHRVHRVSQRNTGDAVIVLTRQGAGISGLIIPGILLFSPSQGEAPTELSSADPRRAG
jgi:hypothetical protein